MLRAFRRTDFCRSPLVKRSGRPSGKNCKQVARRMQHDFPQHRRGDQLQPLRALFVRRPPAVEQAVLLTLQQGDGHRESGGPQQVQHTVQLPEDAVGRRLFGGAVSGDRFASLWVHPHHPLDRSRRVDDPHRVVLAKRSPAFCACCRSPWSGSR